MLSLFPIQKIIAVLGALYAASIILIFSFSGKDLSFGVAIRYATFFELIILVLFSFVWRYLWQWIPKLNEWLFPDINGLWDVEIHWIWQEKKGVKHGEVHIKQNIFTLSMELFTDESESETLVVQPKKNSESGRLHLYYIYRNEPKSTTPLESHIGTAILKFPPQNTSLLEGNYFTDRNTKGVLKLKRKNT